MKKEIKESLNLIKKINFENDKIKARVNIDGKFYISMKDRDNWNGIEEKYVYEFYTWLKRLELEPKKSNVRKKGVIRLSKL